MPGKEGRKESGEKQEQGKASQQLVLPTPGGLDLVRIRGAHGECGGAGNFGAARMISQMEVVEDSESRPHKAVSFVVEREEEVQEWK